MTRYFDWPARLDQAIRDASRTPFCWGQHDCCLWAADAIYAMTGVDMGSGFRAKYDDDLGALRMMHEACGTADIERFAEHLASQFELREVPPLCAQRGDALLVEDHGQRLMAIVGMDNRFGIAAGEAGPVQIPQSGWIRAWRIA